MDAEIPQHMVYIYVESMLILIELVLHLFTDFRNVHMSINTSKSYHTEEMRALLSDKYCDDEDAMTVSWRYEIYVSIIS